MKYFALVALLSVSVVAFPVEDQSVVDSEVVEVPDEIGVEPTEQLSEPRGFEISSDERIENEDLFLPATATPIFFPESEENVNINDNSFVQTTTAPAVQPKSDDVIINKQFFVHSAPEEFDVEDFLPTSPRPSIRVYFIALPPTVVNDINSLKPKPEQNKIIFVVKKNKNSHKEDVTDSSTNEDWKNEISREEIESKSEVLQNQTKSP